MSQAERKPKPIKVVLSPEEQAEYNNVIEEWDSTKEKYGFLDSEIDFYGAVYYTRALLREELHKNGNVISDNKKLIK